MNRLSIDPGISGTGWALWSEKGNFMGAGSFFSRESEWRIAGNDLGEQTVVLANKENVERVYLEFPALFQSAGGMVTARSGALVKLAWFVGYLTGRLEEQGILVEFVEVNEWKGQLPKEVVEKRVREVLKLKRFPYKSHAVDAIGIGLYKLGRMK